MHVGRKLILYLTGNILEVADQEKDLGIIISSDLKCSQQCLYVYDKAHKVLDMIRR